MRRLILEPVSTTTHVDASLSSHKKHLKPAPDKPSLKASVSPRFSCIQYHMPPTIWQEQSQEYLSWVLVFPHVILIYCGTPRLLSIVGGPAASLFTASTKSLSPFRSSNREKKARRQTGLVMLVLEMLSMAGITLGMTMLQQDDIYQLVGLSIGQAKSAGLLN